MTAPGREGRRACLPALQGARCSGRPHLSVQDMPEASSPRGPVAALPQQPYGHGFGGTESLMPPAQGPEDMGTRTWSLLSHG